MPTTARKYTAVITPNVKSFNQYIDTLSKPDLRYIIHVRSLNDTYGRRFKKRILLNQWFNVQDIDLILKIVCPLVKKKNDKCK